jgi:hypothetical protein
VVEHRLAKARVASSNLVSRSKSPSGACRVGYGDLERSEKASPAKARYPSGKGEVCKTFMRRFDPGPRLQSFQLLTSRLIQAPLCRCGEFCGDYLHFAASSPSLRHHWLLFLKGGNLLSRIELFEPFHGLRLVRLGGVCIAKDHLDSRVS